MPAILISLLGGLLNIAGSMVGRVLIALGISVASYTGLSVTLSAVKAQLLGSLNGLPAELVLLLGYMGVGQFISIVTSALTARMVLNGLAGDTVKRWVVK